MVNQHLLDAVMIVEAMIIVVSLIVFFAHGLWLHLDQKRERRILDSARASLARLVNRGTISIEDITLLRSLPRDVQDIAFLEIASQVGGSGKERLGFAAREVGLLDRAHALCESRRWTKRLRGARLFSRLDVPDPIVAKLLEDEKPAVRAQAAEWAGTQPSEAVLGRLLEMLADPATQARFAVQDSLLRVGTVVANPLAKFLESHTGVAAAAGLKVAEAVASPIFRPSALRHSEDMDPTVRVAAANLLGAIGDAQSAERLIALLKDPESTVRAAAARGLGRMQHWQAASLLADSLRDRTWRVRRDAALALRAIGAPGTLFLRRALKGDDAFAADMAQLTLDLPEAAAAS